jgi:hypothetical protein
MFSPRITAAVTTAIGAAAIGLAVATASTAGATATDDDFISQMTSMGISFPSAQEAVKEGHQVCRELAAGKSGVDVGREVLSQTDLTTKQAAYFVVDATKAYCPELSSVGGIPVTGIPPTVAGAAQCVRVRMSRNLIWPDSTDIATIRPVRIRMKSHDGG